MLGSLELVLRYNERRIQEDNLIKHVLMALGFNMHDLSVLSYPEKNSFNISSQIKTHMPRNTLEMLVFFFFPFPAHLNRIDLHYTK